MGQLLSSDGWELVFFSSFDKRHILSEVINRPICLIVKVTFIHLVCAGEGLQSTEKAAPRLYKLSRAA